MILERVIESIWQRRWGTCKRWGEDAPTLLLCQHKHSSSSNYYNMTTSIPPRLETILEEGSSAADSFQLVFSSKTMFLLLPIFFSFLTYLFLYRHVLWVIFTFTYVCGVYMHTVGSKSLNYINSFSFPHVYTYIYQWLRHRIWFYKVKYSANQSE